MVKSSKLEISFPSTTPACAAKLDKDAAFWSNLRIELARICETQVLMRKTATDKMKTLQILAAINDHEAKTKILVAHAANLRTDKSECEEAKLKETKETIFQDFHANSEKLKEMLTSDRAKYLKQLSKLNMIRK
jgi:hypothetical protein